MLYNSTKFKTIKINFVHLHRHKWEAVEWNQLYLKIPDIWAFFKTHKVPLPAINVKHYSTGHAQLRLVLEMPKLGTFQPKASDFGGKNSIICKIPSKGSASLEFQMLHTVPKKGWEPSWAHFLGIVMSRSNLVNLHWVYDQDWTSWVIC